MLSAALLRLLIESKTGGNFLPPVTLSESKRKAEANQSTFYPSASSRNESGTVGLISEDGPNLYLEMTVCLHSL